MDSRYLLALVVAVVMGWFAFGVIFNLRRGDAILRWMRGGLPRMGEKTTFRWLGSSVAELVIAQAKKPFRRFETVIVLVPRDVPWLWAWAAARGRLDNLILRGQLQTPPRVSLELADPTSWTGRMGLEQAAGLGWLRKDYGELQLMAPAGQLEAASQLLDRIGPQSARLAPRYRRLALRTSGQHIELHVPLPDTKTCDAAEYFEALRDLVRATVETN